jgi:hypothetical protein
MKQTRHVLACAQATCIWELSEGRKWKQLDTTYLAKVHFVEDDLVRMPDTPEPGYEGKHCDDRDGKLVVPLRGCLLGLEWLRFLDDIGNFLGDLLGERFRVGCCRALLVLGVALPHLAAG